ncbi:hypothetical protein [Rhodoferax sediminis]|uniref:Uncharacterized protein n=1 Tax=Rhodoferax aquaticus TaxID=2527691 RepID=A0A515ERW3_9BURK|nr:hypothetical protein EXZ61_15035 [Rhodoferax aquaticus]
MPRLLKPFSREHLVYVHFHVCMGGGVFEEVQGDGEVDPAPVEPVQPKRPAHCLWAVPIARI